MTAHELIGSTCWVVAEIGCNHQGSPMVARSLVDMACECGVGAVKGQLRTLEGHPEWCRAYDSPHAFGRTYAEHRQALELPLDVHEALRDQAAADGVDYSVSVWDEGAAKRWMKTEPAWVKVPSAALTDTATLDVLADSDAVVVLSRGMSTPEEIDAALKRLKRLDATILLHCTSTYPTANEDVHLRVLDTLRRWYHPIPIGISGHWRGIQIDAAAVALGARVIERHITLDRTMKGTDHAVSLERAGLEKLVRDVRAVEAAMGSGKVCVQGCEQAVRAKLRG